MALTPMTARQLITQLQRLVTDYPEAADYPVHLMDMDDGDDGHRPDEPWDCLLTHIELDCFTQVQGPVVSLLAEREPFVKDSPAPKPDSDAKGN